MRYPASEKLEIIRTVDASHLPTQQTLRMLGSPRPSRVWNRIPEPVREKVKDLALKDSELSPRELAVQFTDTEKYFVSEGKTDQKTIQWIVFLSNVYRILKSYDLITSPAYVVLSAADEFHDKTTRPNQLLLSAM